MLRSALILGACFGLAALVFLWWPRGQGDGDLRYLRVEFQAPALAGVGAEETVLVAFWGSWCPPCVEEVDELRRLGERGARHGFRLVVVSVDEPSDAAREAFAGAALILDDPDGSIGKDFRVGRLPAAFLVTRGRVIARFDGKRDWVRRSTLDSLQRMVLRDGS